MPGMFPDERVFLVTDHLGKRVSTVVPDADVKLIDDDHASVEVRVVDVTGEASLVLLPGEVLDASRSLIVPSSALQPNGSTNGHR